MACPDARTEGAYITRHRPAHAGLQHPRPLNHLLNDVGLETCPTNVEHNENALAVAGPS